MKEEWRPVVHYDGLFYDIYEISDCGRLKNVREENATFVGKILSPKTDRGGYTVFCLCHKNQRKYPTAHQLVATSFIGPYPDGMEVNHIDGDKSNNHRDNLEYVTKSDNLKHSFRTDLRSLRGNNSTHNILVEKDIPEIRMLLNEGDLSEREIGLMYGVKRSTIHNIRTKHSWSWVNNTEGVSEK